jgi:oligopeptide transport system substrate-binding protein
MARAQAVDVDQRVISIALGTEPPSLNSLKASDQVSHFVLAHIQEGLMQYDKNKQLVGGVAERWQFTDTGITFWLRHDARWSDGEAVTADDFIYAWQQALAPDNASSYAFILYPIKNAEAINRGDLTPATLGVRAVGSHRLDIEFEQPCPYFLSLTAFMTYYPLRRDWHQKFSDNYAADADKLLFNGPFELSEWVHGAGLKMRKNQHYWARDKIKIEGIHVEHITSDAAAVYNLFNNGSIALAGITADNMADALERGLALKHFATGSLFYLRFNFRPGRETGNLWLRKAIQASFSADTLVNKVIAMPGVKPSYTIFPHIFKAAAEDGSLQPFLSVYPPVQVPQNLSLARYYLKQYRLERSRSDNTGQDLEEPIPALTLLAGDSAQSLQQAEYIQNILKIALGLTIHIDKQIFKQRLEKERQGDFDISMAGWGPDYDDPMTFADLYASWNQNNRGGFNSAEYDDLIRQAQVELDVQKRMHIMNRLQSIAIEQVVALPMYENALIYVQHPHLKNVQRNVFGGDPSFKYAYIER